MTVAILAKGPSLSLYKGRFGYSSVWGLNQVCRSHDLDLCFVMDDLRLRMPTWDETLPEYLKTYTKPIITSRPYPEWPTSVAFPLDELVKRYQLPLALACYSTVDWMLAYAILSGVDAVELFGVDCNQPRRDERERASTALWIGLAQAEGIKITVQNVSFFNWFTSTGTAYEHGMYGFAGPPRIEDLCSLATQSKQSTKKSGNHKITEMPVMHGQIHRLTGLQPTLKTSEQTD